MSDTAEVLLKEQRNKNNYSFAKRLEYNATEESPCGRFKIKKQIVIEHDDSFINSAAVLYHCPNRKETIEFIKLMDDDGSIEYRFSYISAKLTLE